MDLVYFSPFKLNILRQFFGEPIQCDAGAASDGVEGDVLNSYCWMYSSWNIPPKYKGSCSVGNEMGGLTHDEWTSGPSGVSIVYNSYYQVDIFCSLSTFGP